MRSVACVKRAFRRIGHELGIVGFSQKKFRPFMNDQARKLFAMVLRENRSRWLGHVVRDGSRTPTTMSQTIRTLSQTWLWRPIASWPYWRSVASAPCLRLKRD